MYNKFPSPSYHVVQYSIRELLPDSSLSVISLGTGLASDV